jgi:hypothetical protein
LSRAKEDGQKPTLLAPPGPPSGTATAWVSLPPRLSATEIAVPSARGGGLGRGVLGFGFLRIETRQRRREGVSTSSPCASARPRERVDGRALLRNPRDRRFDRPELCTRAWDGRGSVRLVVPEPAPDHRRELSCEGGDRGFTATVTSMSGIGLRSLAHSTRESGTSSSFFRRKPPASRSARATRVRRLLTTRRCSGSYRPARRMRRSRPPSSARIAWPSRRQRSPALDRAPLADVNCRVSMSGFELQLERARLPGCRRSARFVSSPALGPVPHEGGMACP